LELGRPLTDATDGRNFHGKAATFRQSHQRSLSMGQLLKTGEQMNSLRCNIPSPLNTDRYSSRFVLDTYFTYLTSC